MTVHILALAMLPAAAAAQAVAPQVVANPAVIAPRVLPPMMIAPPPCLGSAVIGEKGSGAIIGEKGSDAIIGEKGSGAIIGEKIIGEKGSGEIIGEKGVKSSGNRWSSTGFTTYKHVLVGPPGRRTLSLYGCSSAGGGETVAVYLMGPDGQRKTGWKHFVIATRNGNSRAGTVTLPPPAQGQALGRLPVVVVVENASGKPHVGEYRLTLVD